MLRRDDDSVDADRTSALAVVADGELRLRIRAQPRQAAILADFRLSLHQPMRVIDGERHQLRRFVAGIAEHQALVAGALLEVEALAFVDALSDVGRLLVISDQNAAATIIDAVIGVVVADPLDRVARRLLVVDVLRGRRDLAGEDDQSGVDQRLGRDASRFVLR